MEFLLLLLVIIIEVWLKSHNFQIILSVFIKKNNQMIIRNNKKIRMRGKITECQKSSSSFEWKTINFNPWIQSFDANCNESNEEKNTLIFN